MKTLKNDHKRILIVNKEEYMDLENKAQDYFEKDLYSVKPCIGGVSDTILTYLNIKTNYCYHEIYIIEDTNIAEVL